MKNICIFAASDQDKFIRVWCGIFVSTSGRRYNVLGRIIPNGFCTSRSEIVLVDKGIVQPFFCAINFNFSYMTKTMKSESKSKHSTLTLPSFHETEIQLQQAISLPEISKVLITLCERLGSNTELHVHFVINDHRTLIDQIHGGNNQINQKNS